MARSTLRLMMGLGLLGLGLLAGCESRQDKALDQAKAQAASTNTAQQVQYIDKNGDTVTTVVQPPVAGQAQQITTSTTSPAPGPKPASTNPVITAIDANGQPIAQPAPVSANGSAPAQVAPAAPVPVNVTVPAGTELAIRINQHISVKTSHAGDHFSGEVVEPVSDSGGVIIPKGTPVSGRVDDAEKRGHFKGRSVLELRLTAMTLNGSEYSLDTHDNVRTKKGKGKRSTAFIGGMTGVGMIIGGVATGGLGVAVGGAAGAGAGTLIAGTTGNRDIEIPAESIVHFRLADQLVVQEP